MKTNLRMYLTDIPDTWHHLFPSSWFMAIEKRENTRKDPKYTMPQAPCIPGAGLWKPERRPLLTSATCRATGITLFWIIPVFRHWSSYRSNPSSYTHPAFLTLCIFPLFPRWFSSRFSRPLDIIYTNHKRVKSLTPGEQRFKAGSDLFLPRTYTVGTWKFSSVATAYKLGPSSLRKVQQVACLPFGIVRIEWTDCLLVKGRIACGLDYIMMEVCEKLMYIYS